MGNKSCVGGYTLMCHALRIVSDAIWKRYAPYPPFRKSSRRLGRPLPKYDNRTVLEAVLWIEHAGSCWRDLPAEFGKWDTICQRFHRWRRDGVFSDDCFARLAADLELDLDTVMVDATLVKVHQYGAGAPKADALTTPAETRAAQAIGASRGGLTTRIAALVDKAGRLAGFALTPGNAHEPHSLPTLLDGALASELIADKAYDTNVTLSLLEARDIAAAIPSRDNRKAPRWYDPGVYGMRHFVENRFAALKQLRGIAAGYCKRALLYCGLLNLVSELVAFRKVVSRRPAGGRPAVNRRLAL